LQRQPTAKRLLRWALIGIAIVLAAVLALGNNVGYAKPAHAASVRTITVVEHAITDTEIPTGGGADVKGNILTFNNPVYNPANVKKVGHDEGFCTRIQPQQHIWECLWTTFLKSGQITVEGPYYDNRNSVLSITGGTGAFRDSRGQMKLISRDGGKEYDFVFELS
jgi:allene oxide cyclase